jgi:hypothetical protein
MNLVDGGLVGAFDDHLIDAHMGWPACNPNQRFCHIFSKQRCHTFIDFFSPSRISLKPDQRKFGLGKTWVDGSYSHAGPAQFQAKSSGDLEFTSFACAVRRSTFIGDMPCD